MTEINTHGRNINLEDLTSISEYTKGLGHHGEYVEIFYDMYTGEAWGKYHPDANEWTTYPDPDVIKAGAVGRYRKSPQQIADMIVAAVAEHERTERENAEYLKGGAWA